GDDSPDVVCPALSWLHIEVKRVQNLNLTDACAQAEGDCGGKPWIVAHRRNHAPWLITLRADTFFALLRKNLFALVPLLRRLIFPPKGDLPEQPSDECRNIFDFLRGELPVQGTAPVAQTLDCNSLRAEEKQNAEEPGLEQGCTGER